MFKAAFAVLLTQKQKQQTSAEFRLPPAKPC
jgi:hypothetical protein